MVKFEQEQLIELLRETGVNVINNWWLDCPVAEILQAVNQAYKIGYEDGLEDKAK